MIWWDVTAPASSNAVCIPYEDINNQQMLLKACDEARQSRWLRQKPAYVKKWCYSERQLREELVKR